jgi:serine/threonine-protein kinase
MSQPDGGSLPDPLIGQQLGKDYQVLERIGVGGMGVVYLVEHAALRKRFAAKVLSQELATDGEARARFQAEAHAASQLEHENIVNLTDYGLTADGRPYLIMEFLRGRTLDQRLAEGPLTLEEIVAIVVPVARGLAEAHAEGIVHRDVKPENVFLTQKSGGRWGVKVLDFGIAKSPSHGHKLTKTGQALGSPLYMAPEACRGEEIDHRADIYSLGVLMYLLWCGRVPFDDDNLLRVLQMQVSDPVPPPRAHSPALSPAIEAVILRALEKDPDRRFLSIAVLLAELEAALPDGADRLLIEAARGTTSMRAVSDLAATPFPVKPTSARAVTGVEPQAASPPSSLASAAAVRTPSGTRADDPPPAGPGRRRALLAGFGLAAVAAAVVVLLLARAGGGPERVSGAGASPAGSPADLGTARGGPGAAAPGAAGATDTAAGPSSETARAPGPPAPAQPARPTPPPPEPTIRLAVRTPTAGARVLLDGRELGTTPLAIEVPRGAGTGVVRVEQAGFKAWSREVALSAAVDLDAELVAERAPAARSPARPRGRTRPPPAPDPSSKVPGSGAGGGNPALDIRTRR